MQKINTIILDRDGTVILDKHYLHDPRGVELFGGAANALATLTSKGIQLFLATNQSGIGRGYFPESDYLAVQQRLIKLLADAGATIVDTAYCPHAPEENCQCRKPGPGLWDTLSKAHGLTPGTSIMVGDKAADIGLGLGCELAASVLVLTGKGEKTAATLGLPPMQEPWLELTSRRPGWPHVVASDLQAVCDWVLHTNASGDRA